VAGAVTPFANPCPVCGATDEHAAWAGDVHGFQGATFCPHPRELGHGTGCCCGGRSKPWTAELIPDPARPLDIEERVAALEKCIRFPLRMYVPKWEPLTEVEEAEVRESIAEAAKLPQRISVPMEPRPLSLGDIHCILRECVTVVKPGETLVVRGTNWTPAQTREIQQAMDEMYELGIVQFKALAVFGDELGVAEFEP
jgi:hypothetical protein